MSDNIIKIKYLEEYDAIETSSNYVNVYFPFTNERSTFSRYRAQLFYPQDSTITSISVAIAKGNDFPSYDLPIGIYKFEDNPNTNYGIDNTSNIIVSHTSNSLYISDSTIDFYESSDSHLPFSTITDLNYAVNRGEAYWLVFDCGKVFDVNTNTTRTHDFYFTMTNGWSSIGSDLNDGLSYYATEAQGLTLNTAPLRSDIVPWNFTDAPRDHVIMINGESPVKVAFSLDDFVTNSAEEDLYTDGEWQNVGYKEINLIDHTLGGTTNYGNKVVYTRFARPNTSGNYEYYSSIISSNINYTSGVPIINEILLSYIGTT